MALQSAVPLNPQSNITQSGLVYAASVQFNNQQTTALKMQMIGGSLYMTGYPFGFARWETSQNPESPTLTFAASDNIQTFSPMGQWVVDRYASGALGIDGQLALMSGSFGLSVVSLYQTQQPIEVARYPGVQPGQTGASSDEAFIYTAIVPHPTLPQIFYGFRQEDFVYTVEIQQNGLSLVNKTAYSGNGQVVCCVVGGTSFGNGVYVAFKDALAIFSAGSDGTLQNPQVFNQLQVTGIAATQRYIYVQHSPTYGLSQGQQYPRGLYVFDQNGNNVAFFPNSNDFISFAVGPDDAHLYANIDNNSVQIYRMAW
jgi:hypothetical protein